MCFFNNFQFNFLVAAVDSRDKLMQFLGDSCQKITFSDSRFIKNRPAWILSRFTQFGRFWGNFQNYDQYTIRTTSFSFCYYAILHSMLTSMTNIVMNAIHSHANYLSTSLEMLEYSPIGISSAFMLIGYDSQYKEEKWEFSRIIFMVHMMTLACRLM